MYTSLLALCGSIRCATRRRNGTATSSASCGIPSRGAVRCDPRNPATGGHRCDRHAAQPLPAQAAGPEHPARGRHRHYAHAVHGGNLHAAGTEFSLHYCVRNQSKAAFLDRIAQSAFSANVIFHYDDQPDEQRLRPDELFSQTGATQEIYVCGPAGFIEWVCRAADGAGIAKHRVRYEHFGAKAVDVSQDTAFDVKLAGSGQLFHVPADQSVASVLLAAGVDIYTSCGEGSCGSCVMRLVEGVADHRDVFLTDEEHASGDQFTPCCSRAKSPLLVLDL